MSQDQRPSEEQRVLERLAACIHLVRVEFQPRAHALLLGEPLTIALSDGLDQGGLDDIAHVRATLPAPVLRGIAFHGSGRHPFLLLPCLGHTGLLGLLYLELAPLSRVPSRTQLFVELLGRDVAPADVAAMVATGQEPAPPDSVPAAAANLVILLERNEWNVSRVARILGVTRMTIYNRLRRNQVSLVRARRSSPVRGQRPTEPQSA